jgi:hypothetical protein
MPPLLGSVNVFALVGSLEAPRFALLVIGRCVLLRVC